MSPNVEGTNAFGTAPVWAAFWMISSTGIRTDIKNLSNFTSTAQYPRQQSVLESEFGSLDEVRVVITTQAYVNTTTNPYQYSNFMMGANAYGRIAIDDQSIDMIIKPLGAGQDPLNQRQTMGWKGRLGTVLLDDSWLVNLISTKA